nr:glycosyltransferase family 1 protein [uncultured Rhodopila sp.]
MSFAELQPLYLNGRFLSQQLSGVQRFATEIAAELRRVRGDELTVLVPPETRSSMFPVKAVGRHTGHLWEQLDLPRGTRDGLLLNLGNTAPLLGRRQVVVIHDAGVYSTPEAYSRPLRMWYKQLQRRIVRSSVTVVTVSEFARSEIVRHLHADPESTVVVGEGSDHMERIVADRRVVETAGLVPGRFVLAVGNLAAHKNLIALRDLAVVLAGRGMTLVVAGGVPPRVFNQNGDSLLPQPCRYVGRVTDGELKGLFETAACFVFPSRYEGFGLPAVEAMACGCPVVAADIPALRETCADAAIYCDPASPSDIARQVCLVLDDPGLNARLRQSVRARARAWTWERAAHRLNSVLSLACDNGRATANPSLSTAH